jgi:hypothetical protein
MDRRGEEGRERGEGIERRVGDGDHTTSLTS